MSRDSSTVTKYKVLGCASQGNGSDDEDRLRQLLSAFDWQLAVFDKYAKVKSFCSLLRQVRSNRFDLLVVEGTGFAVGLAAITARVFWGKHYVVSSGDAIEPFLSARLPWGAPFFSMYERILCRCSAGFIGWTERPRVVTRF